MLRSTDVNMYLKSCYEFLKMMLLLILDKIDYRITLNKRRINLKILKVEKISLFLSR